jgi:hypothetical protein
LQLFWQPNGTNGFTLATSATNSALATGSVGIRVGLGGSLDNFSAAAASAPTPQNATLTFSENFATGYPSNLGSQLTSYWKNQVGNLSIVNSSATGQATYNLATLNGISQANVSVQSVVNVAAGQYAGLVTRYQGSGDQNMYLGVIASSGSGYLAQIYVNLGGVWTALASNAIGASGQGTLLFTAIGSTLQLFWQPTGTNGFTLAASAMNSSLTTGSVGMRAGSGGALANFTAAVTTAPTPQNATLPFSENFASATYPSGLGSQLSTYWKNQLGNISIVNGNATGQPAYNMATLNGVNQANVSVQAAVNVAAGQYAGLVTRYQTGGMYLGVITSSGSQYLAQIYVDLNGMWTLLSSASIGTSGQGTLLFSTSGSSLQLSWNGTLVASATDTHLSSGSVGMRIGEGTGITSFSAS